MIEKMSKVTVFSQSARKQQLLLGLRKLGVMHISDLVQKNESVDRLEKINSRYARILSQIEERAGKDAKKKAQVELSDEDFEKVISGLEGASKEIVELEKEIHDLSQDREKLLPFGYFDRSELEYLEDNGINIRLYTINKKALQKLSSDPDLSYIKVAYNGKLCAIATINCILPPETQAIEFELPSLTLPELDSRLASASERMQSFKARFVDAACYVEAIQDRMKTHDEEIIFEKVSATIQDEDEIVYVSGYVPDGNIDAFKSFCQSMSLGYSISEPTEEDAPPTKIKRKGFVKYIGPVFDMLNLIPGYHEQDVSMWFEIFLTLFFAMIIGDAGYGLIFLILAIVMNIKAKKCGEINMLVYIFSIATVIWGSLTGTWFGSEAILVNLPFLQKLVIPELTNFPEVLGVDADYSQNMMMKFCFMIGTVHISLACVLNIVRKIPRKDLSFVADIGWLIDLVLLYLLVLYLVIGESAPLALIGGGVGVGFVLVCMFGAQAPGVPFVKGFKASLAGFFTNFLDTVSCFSNIMSYIRLFAVGMASLAIAQSFNDMAAPLLHGFALPAGILIIVLGHLINIVMGLLSVVVHGVRLNVLEFSNQLGMEWSGYNYDPFRRKKKVDRFDDAV